MKFSWKICVSVLAFSLLIVGIGGYALLSALFQSSFQREVKSAADENRMLQYSFAAYWTTTVQDRSSGFPETDVRRAAQAMQEGMSGTELRFQLYNQEGRELYDSGAEEISAVLLQNGAERPVTLRLPGMTREERDIVLAGCLINYYAG